MDQGISLKTMFVVKVTDESQKEFGQYYGGFNKGAERPYYVRNIRRAKLYSNPKDIFFRPTESVVPVQIKVSDEMFSEMPALNGAASTLMITTSQGVQLQNHSSNTRRDKFKAYHEC